MIVERVRAASPSLCRYDLRRPHSPILSPLAWNCPPSGNQPICRCIWLILLSYAHKQCYLAKYAGVHRLDIPCDIAAFGIAHTKPFVHCTRDATKGAAAAWDCRSVYDLDRKSDLHYKN